jgi:hypothetical protein
MGQAEVDHRTSGAAGRWSHLLWPMTDVPWHYFQDKRAGTHSNLGQRSQHSQHPTLPFPGMKQDAGASIYPKRRKLDTQRVWAARQHRLAYFSNISSLLLHARESRPST